MQVVAGRAQFLGALNEVPPNFDPRRGRTRHMQVSKRRDVCLPGTALGGLRLWRDRLLLANETGAGKGETGGAFTEHALCCGVA